jgi:glycosyltransferase involved in cell wall biosynthesis
MAIEARMKFSVIIPTYNRAEELGETLRSLASIRSAGDWEVIVVDNNSTDDTASVVASIRASFPVRLQLLHEREQGRSAALNAGVGAATGDIIAIADDDYRFDSNWLVAIDEGFRQLDCGYVGGKTLPRWPDSVPSWVTTASGRQRAVLGVADYGTDIMEFGTSPALGGNTAVRRETIERVGLWSNAIGRKAGTLLGQEQREWGVRARNAGLRGFYLPNMIVHHTIPADRLTRRYFYRWFYWHGISRALLYETQGLDMESPERDIFDFSKVPHVGGVPRYLYRTALHSLGSSVAAQVRGDRATAMDDRLWLCFFAGIVQQRWKDRKRVVSS